MFIYLSQNLNAMFSQKIFTTFLCTLFSVLIFAQPLLKGKVIDAKNDEALVGATIQIGKSSVVSNSKGEFSIACVSNSSISISFIGYDKQIVSVNNCDDFLTIKLVANRASLNDIEITATSNVNKSILHQPASITKLSLTELKRGNGLFLDDAINGNVPGVIMQRRAVSSGQQFNIRGYGNGARGTRGVSSNFDGQGYKVYLNDIPITDAEGITLMDDLDFSSIGNVEVTKGPAGSLYGLAIAGAVNLRSITPEKGKTTIGQDVMFGNYGLQRLTTHFQTGNERSSILVNYGHQESDGFTIHNASKKDFVNFVGEFNPNAKQAITAYFGYSSSYDERSGELTLAQYNTDDYSGNIDYIKRNAHSNVYTFRAGLSHKYMFNEYISNTTTIFGTALNSNVSSAGGWTDKASTNFGIRSTFNTKFDLKNTIRLSGITGVEAQRQNATTIGYGMVKNPQDTNTVWSYGNPLYWIIGAISSDVYSTSTTASYFTEWTLELPKGLSVTAGIGMSNMGIKLEDRFYNPATPNRTRLYDTSYTNMISPKFAINKVFNQQFSVYASYSRGYKAPNSSYFYIPVIGTSFNGATNSNLKPEIGDQFEIGTKGELLKGKLSYQLAVFNTIFSDKMTTVAVPNPANTVTLYSYVTNGGKQDHKGLEAFVKYTAFQSSTGFIKSITPFANFTYSDFSYQDYKFQTIGKTVSLPQKDSAFTTDFSGKAVAAVAKVVANLGVDITTKVGVYANVNYFYKDGFPITSDALNFTTSYGLLNAKIGYSQPISTGFNVEVNFGVNNITNVKYPMMVFVNQLPDAYVAAPLKANYFGSINLKYTF
jgi:iron complex outermembrane recepter protein